MHVDEDRPTSEQLDASWDETFERLRSFIAARVRDDDVAADIAQDVLVRSIAAGALERVDNPTAWLYRSARNAVIDHYRTRHVHDPLGPGRRAVAGAGTRRRPAQRRHPRPRRLPATTRRPAARDLPRGARPGRPRRAEPPRRRRRGGHLDVRDEVTRPAGPPPAQGAAHRLLRRAGRPARRGRLLPSQHRHLRLPRPRLMVAKSCVLTPTSAPEIWRSVPRGRAPNRVPECAAETRTRVAPNDAPRGCQGRDCGSNGVTA